MLLQTFRSWSGSLTCQRVLTMLLWPWVSTKTPRINHHTLQESIGVKGGNGKSCDECSMLVPSVNLLDYFGGISQWATDRMISQHRWKSGDSKSHGFPLPTPLQRDMGRSESLSKISSCGVVPQQKKQMGFVEKLGIALHLRINHHFPIKKTAWEVYTIFRHTQINNSKHI